MPSINDLLRSVGNDRALSNVLASLQAREREDWIVAGLVQRLATLDEERQSCRDDLGPARAA